MAETPDSNDDGSSSRRRFLAAAGAVGSAVGTAGCTLGGATDSSGTVVQLAASSDEKSIQPALNETLHAVGVPDDVTLEVLGTSSDIARSQFSQWLSAGLDQPSLLRMDSGWTIPFILRDQVTNLSRELPDVASRVEADYFDASVATATGPDGDLYGVPLFSDFGLMLYRKDLVREAGYDPSGWATDPISWNRFAEVVADAQAQTGTDYGFTFQARVYEGLSCCTFTEFMGSWGGSYFGPRKYLFGPVGERPVTVDEDPVVRANRMIRSFVHGSDAANTFDGLPGGISPNAVFSWSEGPSLSPFANGRAIAHRNWPFAVMATGGEDAFDDRLGVMPIPYGVGESNASVAGMGGSVSALGGWHVTLNPNAKHPEAAKAVVRAMTTDEFNRTYLEELGYVPPKPGLLDSKAVKQTPVMGRYVDTIRYAGEHALPRPVTVAWPMESPRIAQQVSAAFTGEKAPGSAMGDLAGLLREIETSTAQST
ncbi:extracellular solute-binding protein [Halorientalis brevis]|uniref:Extracellular solute-binding protein n=1 Tax=Halorientalis brevis TaxID=1126241 RepID=A0ABD6CBG3_9EURY|nr:extracellular solute-binding protein [Halorientalis brevis]